MAGNKILEVFGKRRVVLPVIHVENEVQAIRNIIIAKRAESDGVFLINHKIDWEELLDVYDAAREVFPDWWIGINCLDLSPRDVLDKFISRCPDVSGIWVDNAGVSENDPDQVYATTILDLIEETRWEGLYFGGVAFKYQAPVKDPRSIARGASHLMDVVTTSGEGTGIAADIKKIETMWDALNDDAALAIASGVTSENVSNYPWPNAFLVNTGISDSETELNECKTSLLVKKVHGWES